MNSRLLIALIAINIGVFIYAKSTYTYSMSQPRNMHERVFGGAPVVERVQWDRIGPIMAASGVISLGLFFGLSKRS